MKTCQQKEQLKRTFRGSYTNAKLKRQRKNNPKWRKQKGVVIAEYNGDEVAVRVFDRLEYSRFNRRRIHKPEEEKEMSLLTLKRNSREIRHP